jgi:hypothetical protein
MLEWVTLNSSGMLSTRKSHEYLSSAENRAVPVLRQFAHFKISTQQSRAIHKHARRTIYVPHSPLLGRFLWTLAGEPCGGPD